MTSSSGHESLLPARWREGLHWQADAGRVSVWFGIATNRWMIGAVFNPEALTLGIGFGPLYFGIGTAYDR